MMNTAPAAPLLAESTNLPNGVASVPLLVGQIFEVAPPLERRRLLEYLLPPMGVLALVTVANGVFANLRFRGAMPDGHLSIDEALKIQPSDVTALVDRLQLVSVDAIDGLAQFVSASPAMASTAAAALLVAVLSRRAQFRQRWSSSSTGQ